MRQRLGSIRTHEKVVRVGDIAADTEQLHEVVKLAVDVATYLFWISVRDGNQRVSARSEHTVTGALTVTTFPSSIKSSRALWQSSRTCASGIGRQALSCAIALGK